MRPTGAYSRSDLYDLARMRYEKTIEKIRLASGSCGYAII